MCMHLRKILWYTMLERECQSVLCFANASLANIHIPIHVHAAVTEYKIGKKGKKGLLPPGAIAILEDWVVRSNRSYTHTHTHTFSLSLSVSLSVSLSLSLSLSLVFYLSLSHTHTHTHTRTHTLTYSLNRARAHTHTHTYRRIISSTHTQQMRKGTSL
jgi:hypothetical protein